MEKQLDGGEAIVEIPCGEHKSNYSDEYRKIEVNNRLTSQQVDVEDDDDVDDIYRKEATKAKPTGKLCKKIKLLFSVKYISIFSITIVLILIKTIDKLENIDIWIFELWEWCVLILAILCGRFLSTWCINAILLLIETQFLLKKKVMYYVHSLRKSVGVFIWFGLILLTWGLLINRGVGKLRNKSKLIVKYITRGLAATLVVAGLWILRTLLVKIINSSIYVSRYFYRIQYDLFNYYILLILSGPPLMGGSESINGCNLPSTRFSSTKEEEGEQEAEMVIDMLELQNLDPNNISVWTMMGLIKAVKDSDFPFDANSGHAIFMDVAKPGHEYITEDDLLRFMKKDEVKQVLARIGGESSETITSITNRSFINWVENVAEHHKGLVLSITDTKFAIKRLNKFVTGITVVVLIIIWLIITKIATTEVLLFISSQFLLAIFTFGASAKSTLEAIIFVFVKYPFDVGDRCIVDGVQVVVEEVNLLTTVFLKYDYEKIIYPNSELASKAISNFNRSPDMSDCVDFDLDVSTAKETISVLKAKIKGYIDRKPEFWHPEHTVRVKGIQDVNKIKMSLYVTHTINFQNYEKRNNRISNLVAKLKNLFEELGIKCHYLSPRSLYDGTLADENI
uniref:mechanosensitive ion channel protein 9-like n=1 Tax=Erigeron canadensis TaxID=72917 RepID=UPI001CB96D09|nr:mechanosensitive ion channel protein 9-like [Erigeron canadensis]